MAQKQDRSKPPQREDLEKLTRSSCVAFAVRAARRVQPLFTHYWPSAPAEHLEAIGRAIGAGAASSKSGKIMTALKDSAAVDEVASAAPNKSAREAAYAVASAAAAAAALVGADDAAIAAKHAMAAVRASATNDYAAAAVANTMTKAFWADYDVLLATVNPARPKSSLHPNPDDIPVDPDRLGPLWPDGEPEGWPRPRDAAKPAGSMSSHGQAPSLEELASIPRWGLAALAARNARRILPLFSVFWKEGPPTTLDAIQQIVSRIERSAQSGHLDPGIKRLAGKIAIENPHHTAARFAHAAIDVVAFAVAEDDWRSVSFRLGHLGAAKAAVDAASAVDVAAGESIAAAMRSDLLTLAARSVAERWSDETPVDPNLCGPLWPDGEPEGWPKAKSESSEEMASSSSLDTLSPPVFLLAWNPDIVSDEDYAAVVTALGDLVRAEGGLGIQRVRSQGMPIHSNIGAGVLS